MKLCWVKWSIVATPRGCMSRPSRSGSAREPIEERCPSSAVGGIPLFGMGNICLFEECPGEAAEEILKTAAGT